MNSMSGIVNRPAAIQFGSDRRPAPRRSEEIRTTEDNDTPLVTPDRQERDTTLFAPAPIGGRVGNVVVDTNDQPIRNIAGGPLTVMLPPAQVPNPLQPPNR